MICYPKKLTAEQVAHILKDRRPQRVVATEFRVNQTMIWRIRAGRSWKRVIRQLESVPS